jgi:hypothetical protein
MRAGLRCRAKGAKEMGEGGAGKIVGCGYLSRSERRQGEAKVRAPAEGGEFMAIVRGKQREAKVRVDAAGGRIRQARSCRGEVGVLQRPLG